MILTRKVRIAKAVVYNRTTKEIENLEVEILEKKVRDIGKYVEKVIKYPVTILDIENVYDNEETYDIPSDVLANYKVEEREE